MGGRDGTENESGRDGTENESGRDGTENEARRDETSSSGPLAHSLLALQVLALAGDGRGDHDLRLLELLDRGVAAGGHRELEGTEEVHRAVVDLGRAEEDLPEGPRGARDHPHPPRQRGVEARPAPVVATAGSLDRPGEGRADPDRVGPAGNRVGDVASGARPTVGDDLHVPARPFEVAPT